MSFFISNDYADGASAAAPQAAQSPMTTLLFFVGMIAIFYFLLIRPQQKRAKEHRKMVESVTMG